MDFLFYSVAAINGYDAFGHYLRASLIVNQCSNYAVAPWRGARRTSGAVGRVERRAATTPRARGAAAPRRPARVRAAPRPPRPDARRAGAAATPDVAPTRAPRRRRAALLDYLFGSDG